MPKLKVLLPIALVAGLGLLAVWPGFAASIVTGAEQTTFYSRTQVRLAIGADGMPAEIYGSPTPTATADEIAAQLRLPASFAKREVHAIEASERERYPNRMVLLFNAGLQTGDTACERPETLGAKAGGGGLSAYAVLCFKDEFYSQAAVTNRSARGFDDAFAESMTDLMLELMPPVGSEDRDSSRGGLFR